VDVRPSDAERRAVVDELQRHCGEGRLSLDDVAERSVVVWSATTHDDLAGVTDDLPAAPEQRRLTGVLSTSHRAGRWRRGDGLRALAVLGGCDADLRRLEGDVAVRATAVLGSVDIVVPRGTDVELSGWGVLGSRKVNVRPGEGPTVQVRAVAVLGTVRVVEHRPVP
jgi:hypothetical protein